MRAAASTRKNNSPRCEKPFGSELAPTSRVGLGAQGVLVMTKEKSTPAPLETEDGQQMDDNVDDLGNKSDKEKLDQPVDPSKKSDKDAPR
jgi:hypothetical protein